MKIGKGNSKRWLYGLLVGGMLAVLGVSVGFYLYQFGGMALAEESAAWADFGTYLSGTVGVAAVTLTLFALVFTLRQQDAMIAVQAEEARRVRAYENAIHLFPKILKNAHDDLKRNLKVSFVYKDIVSEWNGGPVTPDDIMNKSSRFVYFKENHPDFLKALLDRSIGHPTRVIDFMIDQISQAPELFDYFDCLLDEYDYWKCVEAAYAYHVGCGISKEFVKRAKVSLRMPASYDGNSGCCYHLQCFGSAFSARD